MSVLFSAFAVLVDTARHSLAMAGVALESTARSFYCQGPNLLICICPVSRDCARVKPKR